jgi:hypothetical protein
VSWPSVWSSLEEERGSGFSGGSESLGEGDEPAVRSALWWAGEVT